MCNARSTILNALFKKIHAELPFFYKRGNLGSTVLPNIVWFAITDCFYYRGAHFNGVVALDKMGTPCQRWDQQIPHSHSWVAGDFPDTSLSLAKDHCRNPGDSQPGPWCYLTTVGPPEWRMCRGERCHGAYTNVSVKNEYQNQLKY